MKKVIVFGAGTMGAPLIKRLLREKIEITGVVARRPVPLQDVVWISAPRNASQIESALKLHLNNVEVAFLAIPSTPDELPLIKYLLSKNIYVILFCKYALSHHYAELRQFRHMIGANATVGGRTMSLPWLRTVSYTHLRAHETGRNL